MSLLNDALRKKENEARPVTQLEAAALFKNSRGRRLAARRLAIGICAALVLLGAAGAWGWRQWRIAELPTPPLALASEPPAAAAEPEPAPVPAAAAENPMMPSMQAAPTAAPAEPSQPLPIRIPEPKPAAVALQAGPALERSAPATVTRHMQRPPMASAAAPTSAPLPARRITSEPLYQKARLFQRQGRTPEALAMYREVLKIEPNHFDTRLNMSAIYLETGQFTQAQALAADLHRQAPAHPQAMLNLAIAQVGCGRAAEALPLLDQVAASPQAPLYTVYFHKGVALRQLGQTEAAIAWYRKAEALNPGDGRLLFNLALAYDQDQAYAQAVDYYLKYMQAAKTELDAAGRGQIQGRVRALQAELAAADNGEPKP
jgi:tetratricopeptide (TPR) repeat protein